MLSLAGGRLHILEAMEEARTKGEWQWLLELADLLLSAEEFSREAKSAKADALWELGQQATNINARYYYLTSSLELRQEYEGPQRRISSATLQDVPIDVLLNSMPERLRPDITAEVEMTTEFTFPDSGKTYTFIIRRGVGELFAGSWENPDLKITVSESDFKALLGDRLAGLRLMATGRLKIQGGLRNLMAFRNYLLEP